MNTTAYKDFAVALAKEAGAIMRNDFTLGMKKEWKEDNTPVTTTDLVINALALERIKKAYPGHSVIAEEGSDFRENDELVWVCDPVDGTIPFAHGMPTTVFSLALVHQGKSILGVVYDPFGERLYTAEKGKGAFLNGNRISVSKHNTFKNAVIGINWSHRSPVDLLGLFGALKQKKSRGINVGSIIYMGALVAAGEFAAVIYPNKKVHDSASLKILVEEAGGKVTDLWGKEQRYDRPTNGIVASNGVLHESILALIRETVKK
ncbi:MAG: Inositol-phosphate phosphatase [Parcubacteria group bacterium GW2011_GWA1_47_11]|nr:MAG: Inositol-phosphate phosphatase [Parcubacteria group bacterium GW2011_GWA1_47_11]